MFSDRRQDDLLEDAIDLLVKQMQRFVSSRVALLVTSTAALTGMVTWPKDPHIRVCAPNTYKVDSGFSQQAAYLKRSNCISQCSVKVFRVD